MSRARSGTDAPVLRLGTRGSLLALTQSGHVADLLTAVGGMETELVRIRTEGDVNLGPLATIGGTGVFVTAVREALLDGRVDVVVHSCKDLPTAPAQGLVLAAVPPREDPTDVLCARDGLALADLPDGARVGTGSPRRAAQLLRLRPDLEVVPIRGNIDTRLGLVIDHRMDAVVLAAAGLARLGRSEAATERFDELTMLPAPAQGALAVEVREADARHGPLAAALAAVDDRATAAAVAAERALLAGLEAGCTAPVGAFAQVQGGAEDATAGRIGDPQLTLTGAVFAPDGSREIRSSISGPAADAARLGRELAGRILAAGAADLLPRSGP